MEMHWRAWFIKGLLCLNAIGQVYGFILHTFIQCHLGNSFSILHALVTCGEYKCVTCVELVTS